MRECTRANGLSNVFSAVRAFVPRVASRHMPWFIQINDHSSARSVVRVLNDEIFFTPISVHIQENVPFCAVFVVVVLSRMETVKSMNKHTLKVTVFKTHL
jgi:hypothetical protein